MVIHTTIVHIYIHIHTLDIYIDIMHILESHIHTHWIMYIDIYIHTYNTYIEREREKKNERLRWRWWRWRFWWRWRWWSRRWWWCQLEHYLIAILLGLQSLHRPAHDIVPRVRERGAEARQCQAIIRLPTEEVSGEAEVLEVRQRANLRGHIDKQPILGHVELLQILQQC